MPGANWRARCCKHVLPSFGAVESAGPAGESSKPDPHFRKNAAQPVRSGRGGWPDCAAIPGWPLRACLNTCLLGQVACFDFVDETGVAAQLEKAANAPPAVSPLNT